MVPLSMIRVCPEIAGASVIEITVTSRIAREISTGLFKE
jgi:hypothetical protein